MVFIIVYIRLTLVYGYLKCCTDLMVESKTWSAIPFSKTDSVPKPRCTSGFTPISEEKLLLFGGDGDGEHFNDVWILRTSMTYQLFGVDS